MGDKTSISGYMWPLWRTGFFFLICSEILFYPVFMFRTMLASNSISINHMIAFSYEHEISAQIRNLHADVQCNSAGYPWIPPELSAASLHGAGINSGWFSCYNQTDYWPEHHILHSCCTLWWTLGLQMWSMPDSVKGYTQACSLGSSTLCWLHWFEHNRLPIALRIMPV